MLTLLFFLYIVLEVLKKRRIYENSKQVFSIMKRPACYFCTLNSGFIRSPVPAGQFCRAYGRFRSVRGLFALAPRGGPD